NADIVVNVIELSITYSGSVISPATTQGFRTESSTTIAVEMAFFLILTKSIYLSQTFVKSCVLSFVFVNQNRNSHYAVFLGFFWILNRVNDLILNSFVVHHILNHSAECAILCCK